MKAALTTLVALVAMAGASNGLGPDAPGVPKTAPKAKAELKDSAGKEVGSVEAEPVGGGLRIIVKVHDMAPGDHGVHIHNGSACGTAGGANAFAEAGDHLDPKNANRHAGLNGGGHAGDLGNMLVGADGKGKLDVVADGLDIESDKASIVGKPLVVHSQRDNGTDKPESGGSDGRLACGVFEREK